MNIFRKKKELNPQNFKNWDSINPTNKTIEHPKTVVVIESSVNQEIEKYSHIDLKNEVGGVLVGRLNQEGIIEVLGAIEAKYADHKAASLTFTHESWNFIHSTIEQKYSDLNIVGWFHTHPGYGIFLSSYDLFIHKNFFRLPYQVALVIDPCQNLRGVFTWNGENIEKQSTYFTGISSIHKIAPLKLVLDQAEESHG